MRAAFADDPSRQGSVRLMCNLYSITTNQAAIADLFRLVNRYVGNLPAMPSVFPDYPAPVIRAGGREMTLMRWGMPSPPQYGGPPVTNIRNVKSPHWKRWLKPESRCLARCNISQSGRCALDTIHAPR
ncbi:putative SOS response-associated peptidase YedK [Bradyrhizobium sp. USDA 3240]